MRRKFGQLVRGQIARITVTIGEISERDWRRRAAVGDFLGGNAVVGAVLVDIYVVIFVGVVCDEDTGCGHSRCGTDGCSGCGRCGRCGGGRRLGDAVDGIERDDGRVGGDRT